MMGGPALGKALRYGAAAVGPIGSAGAQFLLSLALLRALDARDFGAFSFLLVASQFSWGLWSALFCAPLPILFHGSRGAERDALMLSLFSANLVVAALAGGLFLALALALGLPSDAATLFAAYAAFALLRWFARAHAYAEGRPLRTTVSDLVYAVTLLIGVSAVLWTDGGAPRIAYGALFVSAVLGMTPFGLAYLRRQFLSVRPAAVKGYLPVWRRHSGWSLLGVLTTEATANSHAYLVTAFFGPAAFAPVAASALVTRPVGVAMNALTEFERAQMARAIGGGRIGEALAAARFFRLAMVAAWLATAAAVAALFAWAPRLVFPPEYPLRFLATAGALWMIVAGVRLLRQPDSALLQAAGEFRPLALASVWSSGVSVVAVASLLWSAGVLPSIFGILAGEIAYALWVRRRRALWLRDRAAPAHTAEAVAA